MSYSPKVNYELVKRLYRLKIFKSDKKPLTYYVNEAIEQYLKENERTSEKSRVEKEGVENGKAG